MIRYKDLPAELKRPSNAWGILMLARTWLVILGAIALATCFHSAFAWVVAYVTIGLMQYHLSVLGHHSMHKNVFPVARVNEIVARILLLAPLGLPLPGARANHMRHHTLFQTEADYEWDNYNLARHGRATVRGFVKWLGGAYIGGTIFATISRVLKGEAAAIERQQSSNSTIPWPLLGEWAIVVGVQTTLLVGAFLVTGKWYAYVVLWILPLFTLTTGLSLTRATLEHADLDEPPHRLMTFPAGPVQRAMWGPFNFNWHAEHHLFPAVPACNLRRLHFYLLEHEPQLFGDGGLIGVVPSYTHRLGQLLRQCRKQTIASAA